MLLTSFTENRKIEAPKLDFEGGQFLLQVKAFELSTPDQSLPADLHEWPDAVCAAAVRGIVQDICALERSDWFFESAVALQQHAHWMCQNEPWLIQMGPLSLHMIRGAQDPTSKKTERPALSLELTAEPGDPPLSDDPDVAKVEAKALWEAQPEDPDKKPLIPVVQQVTDAQLAGAVRALQEDMKGVLPQTRVTSAVAFVAAGAALVIELVMANLRAAESEITFSDAIRPDGTPSPLTLLAFRDKTKDP